MRAQRRASRRTATKSEAAAASGVGSGEMSMGEHGVLSYRVRDIPIKKLLVANRGEIAVRIFRAAAELGVRTVAVYSDVDRAAAFRYKADESYPTSGATPVAAYLNIDRILEIAKANNVDAIHPGYGFLSENTEFARRCEEAGIRFVGPRPETIAAMGDKMAAKAIADACEVPTVPGTEGAVATLEEAQVFVERYGFPLMIKAAMGGGGRGMRVVRKEEDFAEAFSLASREATSAFGDGRCFLERFIGEPRHIEVQILADGEGNVVHLHERDCSVQRRHQKVVELAPSPTLDDAVRARLFEDAVKIAKHVGYRNAGTVEFMVDTDGSHYFLEVNPRIQVEHTVTEQITGIDLVQSQIMIAGGTTLEQLGIASQDDITVRGYAIQCRVTTEDPLKGFRPDTGKLEVFRISGGMGIRLDSAVSQGSYISPNYDSMMCKVTANAVTFKGALSKLSRSLAEFRVRGVKTNIPFVQNVLRHPDFMDGSFHTNFVDEHPELFDYAESKDRATKLLTYLAEMQVNGIAHPGATGPQGPKLDPYLEPPKALWATAEDGGAPKSGVRKPKAWRPVLLKEGPKAFAKAVRAHDKVLLTDTTWRDAHQSLLATRMRTYDMMSCAPATRDILHGAFSLEMWGGATFDVSMRFLNECPWARLELLREEVKDIPFQMLLRGANAVGYTSYADNVVRAFTKQARVSGVDVFRVFDSLNYIDNLKFGIDCVRDADGVVEGTICYTGDVSDPNRKKYDLEYYLKLADELVSHGIDTLAIKDMAGLLKPKAAKMLIGGLRKQHPDLVLHLHTHDTAGTGVATYLAAIEAGVDVVDTAVDSMSGLTSQPSAGAVIGALSGEENCPEVNEDALSQLSTHWEKVRSLYSTFESGIKAGSADVYVHEMPGGQFTNLKFQSASLGLGDNWDEVKRSYALANKLLGDIVKVTPSSKVCGDMANFLVANKLTTESEVLSQASSLNFPESVIDYFQGYLGQPPYGFPKELQDVCTRGKKVITVRPGSDIEPMALTAERESLQQKYGPSNGTELDMLSSAMYPDVYKKFASSKLKYGDLSVLPTHAYFQPLDVDEEISVRIEQGKTLFIKMKAVGELKPDGYKTVFFELNGLPRQVEVLYKPKEGDKPNLAATADKADPDVIGSIGAPMSGDVISVDVKPGQKVKAGDKLATLSAMKMETVVLSPIDGIVAHCGVSAGGKVNTADLICLINAA